MQILGHLMSESITFIYDHTWCNYIYLRPLSAITCLGFALPDKFAQSSRVIDYEYKATYSCP